MVANVSKFMVFTLLKNTLVSQKVEIRHFHTCSAKQKALPGSYYQPPWLREITHSPQATFYR